MDNLCTSAVILCPKLANPGRRLLGLQIGERLLLALSHAGIQTVTFIGEGTRPSSDRANLKYQQPEQLDSAQRYLVMSSDTVFDKSLVNAAQLATDLPMAQLTGQWLKQASISELLAALGTGRADSGQAFAIRVDSKQSAKQAERALLLSLRKPIDGFVSTHLNRYISLFCTRYLVKTGLPPNFFTLIFTAIGLCAAVFATQAEHAWALVMAGLLFQSQSILDGCDGEMARLTYRFSRSGQWFDSVGDDLTNYSVCFGLAIGQARVLDQPSLYWIGAAVLVLQCLTSGILYRRMILLKTGDLLAIPDLVRAQGNSGFFTPISDVISAILKRDSFIFILSFIVLIQQPLIAFYAYAIGTLPMVVGVFLNDYRIAKQNKDLSSGVTPTQSTT